MIEKDPTSYQIVTYVWVIVIATLGGFVSYLRKVRAGETRPFNFPELIGEIVTSGFVGIITFWLCEAAEFDPLMTAAFVGIAGHMGSKAIFMFEKIIESRFGSIQKDKK